MEVKLGYGYYRVGGDVDGENREYEIRYPYGTARIKVMPEMVTMVNAVGGRMQVYERGTFTYDAIIGQLNSREHQEIFRSLLWWKRQANVHHGWVANGKPDLNPTQVKAMKLYMGNSPLTWK